MLMFALEGPSYFNLMMYRVSSTHSILTSFMFLCFPSIFQYLIYSNFAVTYCIVNNETEFGTYLQFILCTLFCAGYHCANRRKIIEITFHKGIGQFRVLCLHLLFLFQIDACKSHDL